MPHRDKLSESLSKLTIPEPRSNAVHCIMQAAAQEKRQKVSLFDPIRRLRAQLYVPTIRYTVMASIFGAFIAIGGVNRLNQEAPIAGANTMQQAQTQMERIPITASNLPDEVLLYDVDFGESDPLEAMWET